VAVPRPAWLLSFRHQFNSIPFLPDSALFQPPFIGWVLVGKQKTLLTFEVSRVGKLVFWFVYSLLTSGARTVAFVWIGR
jgi:hypothetical protein